MYLNTREKFFNIIKSSSVVWYSQRVVLRNSRVFWYVLVFADQLSRSISLYFSHMQYRDLYIVVKLWLNKHGPTWEGFFQALTMVQKEKIISI